MADSLTSVIATRLPWLSGWHPMCSEANIFRFCLPWLKSPEKSAGSERCKILLLWQFCANRPQTWTWVFCTKHVMACLCMYLYLDTIINHLRLSKFRARTNHTDILHITGYHIAPGTPGTKPKTFPQGFETPYGSSVTQEFTSIILTFSFQWFYASARSMTFSSNAIQILTHLQSLKVLKIWHNLHNVLVQLHISVLTSVTKVLIPPYFFLNSCLLGISFVRSPFIRENYPRLCMILLLQKNVAVSKAEIFKVLILKYYEAYFAYWWALEIWYLYMCTLNLYVYICVYIRIIKRYFPPF